MNTLVQFNKYEIQLENAETICDIQNEIQSVNTRRLLDMNNVNRSILEMFVWNLAQHQLSTFDRNVNISDMYVEFSNECRLNIQDENHIIRGIRTTPLVCSYTFFNKSTTPLIITNLDFEKYKYKEFTDENDLVLVFPSEMDHVSFNGSVYHGFQPIFNTTCNPAIALKINIYDKPPDKMEYYKPYNNVVSEDIQIQFKEQRQYAELIVDTKMLNRKFMENILYNKFYRQGTFWKNTRIENEPLSKQPDSGDPPEFIDFTNIFLNYESYIAFESSHLNDTFTDQNLCLPLEVILFHYNNLFVIRSQKIPLLQTQYFLKLIEKHGYVMYDILDFYKKKITNTNRFYKEQKLPHFFSEPVCNWIISEVNLVSNTDSNTINIEKIPTVFRFIITHFQQIVDFAIKSYGLINFNINFTSMQIIKASADYVHTFSNKHLLKVIIPLSKQSVGDLFISNTITETTELNPISNECLLCYLDFVYN